MKKQVTVDESGVLVKLAGEMYIEDAENLRRELLEYTARGNARLIIDMGDMTYIDSSGIAALIAVHKSAQRVGGSVTLTGLKGVIDELFEVTRLKKVFQIQD